MTRESPLRSRHEAWVRRLREPPVETSERPGAATGRQVAPEEVTWIPWGVGASDDAAACEVVASLGSVELEYAAVRKGVGLLDRPDRGTLRVTGSEGRAFLDHVVTQDLSGLVPGTARSCFLLDRAGRVEADLVLVALDDEILIDVDLLRASHVASELQRYVIMEDLQVEDATDRFYRIAMHGPGSPAFLATLAGGTGTSLENGTSQRIMIAGSEVLVVRRDEIDEPGLALCMPFDEAPRVWDALLEREESGVRPIGWHAFNIARIEAGCPIFHIDFGPEHRPHETGVLADRVSFTKGCYPGQEIVARTENRGRPKRRLVGLRVRGEELPTAGAAVHRSAAGEPGETVGVVTSSAVSPLLGAAPIAFAMVRIDATETGTILHVPAEHAMVEAVVGDLRASPGS